MIEALLALFVAGVILHTLYDFFTDCRDDYRAHPEDHRRGLVHAGIVTDKEDTDA
jgi:hypothetical protein